MLVVRDGKKNDKESDETRTGDETREECVLRARETRNEHNSFAVMQNHPAAIM